MVQEDWMALKLKLRPTDWAVILYNLSLTVFIFTARNKLDNWDYLIASHLIIMLLVWFIAWNNKFVATRLNRWVSLWYPIILILWFYPESGLLRHIIFPRDFDPELLLVETELFPQRYYFTVPLSLSVFTLEFFHAAYFSYYLLLWVPAMIAHHRQRSLVREYIFVLMTVMFVLFWITIVFPASGPIPLREHVIPEGIIFIPLMNLIYSIGETGGAAFPSTHAAAAVVATLYSCKMFPKASRFIILWLFLILISTVVCTFHYTIDTIAGMFSGTLCLLAGKKLYEKIS